MREILEKVLGIVCNLSLVGSYCISADTDQPDPTAAGNGTDGEHRTDSIRRKSNLGKSDCGSNTDFRHDGAGR